MYLLHTPYPNPPPPSTVTADQLWKGVTSVSNAGKKQGRGKGVGKRMAKNLNRGQVIGVGEFCAFSIYPSHICLLWVCSGHVTALQT